jgi:hypothetical protein
MAPNQLGGGESVMKALKVTADNAVSTIELSPPLYKSLQPEVGGYFEIVHPRGLKHPFVMIVDEEGLLKDKPLNLCGSVLYETRKHDSPIVGDIVIMREDYGAEGPDIFGLEEQHIEELIPFLNSIIAQN